MNIDRLKTIALSCLLSLALFVSEVAHSQPLSGADRPEVCRKYDELAAVVLRMIEQHNARHRREQQTRRVALGLSSAAVGASLIQLRSYLVPRLVRVGAAAATAGEAISWRYVVPRILVAGVATPIFLYELFLDHPEYRDPHSDVLQVVMGYGIARPEEACRRVLESQRMQDQLNDWWSRLHQAEAAH